MNSQHLVTHGMSNTDEYNIWRKIKNRCLCKTNDSYENYGARGITISNEWQDSFETFYKDIGPRPSKKHSVDRIDNNGNYCKENCRWATKIEQSNNTRRNIYLEYDGKNLTITDWSKLIGLDYRILSYRFKKGWSSEKILTTPKFSRENKQ